MASAQLSWMLLGAPALSRGRHYPIAADPDAETYAYGVFHNVAIRTPSASYMLSCNRARVTSVAFSADGNLIAAGDASGTVVVFERLPASPTGTGGDEGYREYVDERFKAKVLGGPILDISFSPDARYLGVGGEMGSASLISNVNQFSAIVDLDSGDVNTDVSRHDKVVVATAVVPRDGENGADTLLATASEDMTVQLFEGPPFSGKKTTLRHHKRFVNSIRASHDATRILCVSSDKSLSVVDAASFEVVLTVEDAHTGSVIHGEWAPNDAAFATVGSDAAVCVWDATSGDPIAKYSFADSPRPRAEDMLVSVAWLSQTSLVILDAASRFHLVPDIGEMDGAPAFAFPSTAGLTTSATCLAYNPATNTLLAGSQGGAVLACAPGEQGTHMVGGQNHAGEVLDLASSPKTPAFASVAHDGALRIGDADAGEYTQVVTLSSGAARGVAVGSGSPALIAAACEEGVVLVRDGEIFNKTGLDKAGTAAAISPAENEVAIGCADGSVRLFDVEGAEVSELLTLFRKHPISDLEYSPDGAFLACSMDNGDITVWSTDGYEVVIDGWEFHDASVYSIAWAPDSVHLLSSCMDGSLMVWSVAEPRRHRPIQFLHVGGITGATFVSDKTIATTGHDCAVKTFDLLFGDED